MKNSLVKKIDNSSSLIDILIQIEDFIDSLDIYAYENWFEGELVDGPNVERYWVDITLKYDDDVMPDPEGALRLMKHGVKVKMVKAFEEIAIDIDSPSDYREEQYGKPKMEMKKIWLIHIKLPRKFIDELDDSDIELGEFDDDIEFDLEVISDARDEDIDADDAYREL